MKLPSTFLTSTGAGLVLLGATASAQITFTNGATIPSGQRPDAVAFGDFDGDGDQDFAVTTGPQGAGNLDAVEIYSNDGAGNFSLFTSILTGNNTSPGALVSADLNNDGVTDLAVALQNANSVLVLLGNGTGGFTMAGTGATGLDPRSIAVADMDNDGDLDVVTANRDGNSVSVLRNNGAGSLAAGTNTNVGIDVRGVALGDFNADGLIDVAASSHDTRQVGVMMNGGTGNLGAPNMMSVGAGRRSDGLATGDFNGDGMLDIAAATSLNNDSWATVFTNLGGSFGAPVHYAFLGFGADALLAADFDLDGDLDLATTNQDSNNVSVLTNFGASFGSPTLVGTGTRPGGLAAGDIDGDGDLDLGTANRDANSVSMLVNPNSGASWTSFCNSSINSAANAALMGASGSVSIQANTFTLEVTGSVPQTMGLFLYAAQPGSAPLGNGTLCLSGSLLRLNPPLATGPTGSAMRLLDFTQGNPSSGAGMITPGSTWHFQFWYRDTAAGGAQFNLSDGLSVTFQS